MRLAPFIRAKAEQIIGEWENFAATMIPTAEDASPLALRDHIKDILAFVADDLENAQTEAERLSKSHGKKDKSSNHSVAETHAALRLAGGFDLDQMVSEYRALRASVTKLWTAQLVDSMAVDISDLTRFNESIDQEMTESIRHYSKALSSSKDLFLGVLSHDLRNPLGTITMSSNLILKLGALNEQQAMLVHQNIRSAARAMEIVNYLLDLTRARFGSGLPVIREPMDIGFVTRQLVDEMQILHPTREFQLKASGDLDGNWDKARIGQVLSNLLGNAVRYSFSDSPIRVTMEGHPDFVILSVHNDGVPIPSDAIGRIFDSLTRAEVEDGAHHPESVNLGLGLYITKEVLTAHGGTITVTSSEKGGTTFTARFPRAVP